MSKVEIPANYVFVGQSQVNATGGSGNESSGIPYHAYEKADRGGLNYRDMFAYYIAIHAVDTIFFTEAMGGLDDRE